MVGQEDRGQEGKGNTRLQGSARLSLWLHRRVKRRWVERSVPRSQLRRREDSREPRKLRTGLVEMEIQLSGQILLGENKIILSLVLLLIPLGQPACSACFS